MRFILIVFTSFAAMLASFAVAASEKAVGEEAYSSCMACHGADGSGNLAMKAPALNHLEPVYVVAQLQKFRSGLRGASGATSSAMQMAGMARVLADEQALVDVATYIGTLEGSISAATVAGDVTMGADYFNQLCGACHGPAAEGNVALGSPRLAGGNDWYLLEQLNAFRAGTRGGHADDRTGRQMRAMAGTLPDDQAVRDVVAFIQSLGQ